MTTNHTSQIQSQNCPELSLSAEAIQHGHAVSYAAVGVPEEDEATLTLLPAAAGWSPAKLDNIRQVQTPDMLVACPTTLAHPSRSIGWLLHGWPTALLPWPAVHLGPAAGGAVDEGSHAARRPRIWGAARGSRRGGTGGGGVGNAGAADSGRGGQGCLDAGAVSTCFNSVSPISSAKWQC